VTVKAAFQMIIFRSSSSTCLQYALCRQIITLKQPGKLGKNGFARWQDPAVNGTATRHSLHGVAATEFVSWLKSYGHVRHACRQAWKISSQPWSRRFCQHQATVFNGFA